MQVRPLTPEDSGAAEYLEAQAFSFGRRRTDTDEPVDPILDSAATYGVWDGGALRAKVVVIPLRAVFGGNVQLGMGGIAGVACLPESRGRGFAGAGLRYSLERMKEGGLVVSTLFPFSWSYYAGFGWEWVGVQRRMKVATRRMPRDSADGEMRAAGAEDRPGILAAYMKLARRYRGMIDRPAAVWAQMLDDKASQHTYTFVYRSDGEVEGYLTYRGGTGSAIALREFICLTPRAYRAALGFLRRYEMQTDNIQWTAPGDDPGWLYDYDWHIHTRIRPVTQGRVVDVPGALAAWSAPPEMAAAFRLAITDACAPWNTATWRVEFAGGRILVVNDAGPPDVSMEIGAFSQAFFGTPTVGQIRAAGKMEVANEAGYAALRDLLSGPPMWMNDDF